ncbi:MAG: hypothetical protein HUU26_01715, partial [Gemmatimonadaceae bacterium]|nr:hypothetical protein [Gemmatimonadaceae bacterium]
MKTEIRKAARKAGQLATRAGKAAVELKDSAEKAVATAVKRQQRKRRMARVAKTAKQVGVAVAAAAAVT